MNYYQNELLPDISVSAAADDRDKDVAAGDKQNDKITKGSKLVYKSKVEEAQKITAIARNILQDELESQENILEHDLIKISHHIVSNVILDAQTCFAEEKREHDLMKISNHIIRNVILDAQTSFAEEKREHDLIKISNHLVSNIILDARASPAEEKRQQEQWEQDDKDK